MSQLDQQGGPAVANAAQSTPGASPVQQQVAQAQAQPGAAPDQTQTPQVPQRTTPTTEPAAPSEETWEARYRGLMNHVNTLNDQLAEVAGQRDQVTEAATTMQAQVGQWQALAQQGAQQLEAMREQVATAQIEAAYQQLVAQEYPDLIGIAPALQRAPTPELQRQILQGVRTQIQGTATQQATQQVYSQMAGVTPGAAPAPGNQPATQPTYEEVMNVVMDETLHRRDPDTYNAWMEIYRNHPGMNHESLGTGPWRDPIPNHFRSRAQALGMQPASLSARPSTQAITSDSPGNPNVWAGNLPAAAPVQPSTQARVFAMNSATGTGQVVQGTQAPGASMPNAIGGPTPPQAGQQPLFERQS